ncbi:MAG: cysteine desulfurase family protein [Bacillota bacterium]|nr:cysteine desulfurase family protein [Bacillota bacterium]
MKEIYFDNAATTAARPEVAEILQRYLLDIYGNPSSLHSTGQKAKRSLETARKTVADIIEAEPGEIFFTSGGTESNNIAIKGTAYANLEKGNHIITSSIEHHAVINVYEELEKQGFDITVLPVDHNGIIDLEILANSLRRNTTLISIMLVNNEIGTIQPLAKVTELAKDRGIIVHTDAVQAVGKIPVSVNKLGVDLLSMTAHKIHGPKGIGALYKRDGLKIKPLFEGGHQEKILRPGTENIPGIVALSAALQLAADEIESENKRLATLRDKLEEGIRNRVNDIKINGHPDLRVPNISNISFKFIEGEALLLSLDIRGIAVSTASACSAGATEPSHVLKAIGLDPLLAQGSIRFSLGHFNTADEVNHVIDAVEETVNKLRELSPIRKT